MKPHQKLHFAAGELFTTYHDRPEQTLCTVDDGVRHVLQQLTPDMVAYASSPERGEYRGFAALHDLCDANLLLPLSDGSGMLSGEALPAYTDFCNAVVSAVTAQLVARPKTPPLEELRITLEGAAFLRDSEADEEHPDPVSDACEMIDDALTTLTDVEKEHAELLNVARLLVLAADQSRQTLSRPMLEAVHAARKALAKPCAS